MTSFLMLNFSNISYIIYILLIFTITVLILRYFRYLQKYSVLNRIPGPKTTFLFGNALEFMGSSRDIFECVVHKMCCYPGGLTRIWIMQKPFVYIYGASGVEALLNNSKNLDKARNYSTLHSWLGFGLLTSSGSRWHMSRKMLTPAFHFKILEEFIEVFNQQSQKFVSKLQKHSDGKPFNIFPSITLATLDIILETAMGRSINAQDNPQSEYVKAVCDVGQIVIARFSRPWLQFDFIFRRTEWGKLEKKSLEILHKFSLDAIRERKKEYQRMKSQKIFKEEDDILGKRKLQPFLNLLIEYSEQNDHFTEENIREEVDTFMFEGHDTIAAAINWTIYLLGRNPEIQEKVFRELDAIFEDSERAATSADIREMSYLECCIKESLRLLPSVPYFARCLSEDLIIDGYLIPRNTDVIVVTYNLHRDPKYFPDPNSFNPDRFTPENSANRNPYAYVPFSAGPRNCIGQKFALLEEKVILSFFFRKYQVESLVKFEDLKLTGDLIIRPEEETLVKIFPRKER